MEGTINAWTLSGYSTQPLNVTEKQTFEAADDSATVCQWVPSPQEQLLEANKHDKEERTSTTMEAVS